MLNYHHIKESAIEAGFDLVGITRPRLFEANRTWYTQWIASGAASPLSYMHKYMELRFDPSTLLEGAHTIVVCALNYKNNFSLAQPPAAGTPTATPAATPATTPAQIASYALATDYHKVIRRQLRALLRTLQATHPTLEGRCCVDTAPLLEKQLAHEAGLGWIGRSSLVVTPQFGTFVLLGVLLLSDHVDTIDTPYTGDGCANCRRCIEACPTGAITPHKMIDTRRCISALTVECDTPSAAELGGWIFGCDECQRCCPHNRTTPLATSAAIQPIVVPPTHEQWAAMSPSEFSAHFGATPLKRGGLQRLQRNAKSISHSTPQKK